VRGRDSGKPRQALGGVRLVACVSAAALVGAGVAEAAAPKRIAFDTSYGINVVAVDGSGLRSIVPKRGAGEPRWSPDGRWIVYVKHTFADRMQLGPSVDPRSVWLVRPDGTGDRQLVGANAYAAAWSLDGKEVRFLRRESTGNGSAFGEVQAIDIETRRIRSVGIVGPTYLSPDGRFAQTTEHGSLFRSDGTSLELGPPRGSFRTYYNLPGGFSPRGKVPYSCRERGSERTDLCVLNPDDGTYRRIPTPRGLWELQGAYSRNGKLIAVSGRDGLFVIAAGGASRVRWLMRNPSLGGSNTPFNPTWEP
jgi:dipeptidyl aminopeptidase/acylaminoacyl peptidase